jgi:hypothetical protein
MSQKAYWISLVTKVIKFSEWKSGILKPNGKPSSIKAEFID